MYIGVELSSRGLNSGPCLFTNIYTCGVTVVLRVHSNETVVLRVHNNELNIILARCKPLNWMIHWSHNEELWNP